MSEQEMTDIAVLKEQVTSLRDRIGTLEKDVQSKFDRIEKKLDEAIKEKDKRPSWSMTLLVSTLMTICASLVVYLVTH